MKFTGGPWGSSGSGIYKKVGSNLDLNTKVGSAQKQFAIGYTIPDNERDANARLMALSPELFELSLKAKDLLNTLQCYLIQHVIDDKAVRATENEKAQIKDVLNVVEGLKDAIGKASVGLR